MLTERDYDEAELRELRWKLADVSSPGRQVTPSASGQEYRRRLSEDIAEFEARLASEGTDTIPESPTATEARAAEASAEAMSSDQEKGSFALSSQPSS